MLQMFRDVCAYYVQFAKITLSTLDICFIPKADNVKILAIPKDY